MNWFTKSNAASPKKIEVRKLDKEVEALNNMQLNEESYYSDCNSIYEYYNAPMQQGYIDAVIQGAGTFHVTTNNNGQPQYIPMQYDITHLQQAQRNINQLAAMTQQEHNAQQQAGAMQRMQHAQELMNVGMLDTAALQRVMRYGEIGAHNVLVIPDIDTTEQEGDDND